MAMTQESLNEQIRAGKDKFFTTVLQILSKDCTQTSNDAEGTQLRILDDEITIEDGISAATITWLKSTGYLLDCNSKGQLRIRNITIGKED